MDASSLQIYWHESQPIYSLCFQHTSPSSGNNRRLVTAGGDNKIRIWQLNFDEKDKYKVDTIDFLSSLTQHEQAVNVVRFDSLNETLATAGDDGQLLLWRKNDAIIKDFGTDDEEFADFKESWFIWKRLRSPSMAGSSEIYDLCWSPDNKYIVTGSMDNSVRVFDVEQCKCIVTSTEHNHYVQGVVWDPLNEYIVSQSADRSLHVHKILRDSNGAIKELKIANKITKGETPMRVAPNSKELRRQNVKSTYLFHNETLPSFFRRLCMSPCGSLLCTPTGILKNGDGAHENSADELANSVYIFTRSSLDSNSNTPVLALPFLKKPALAISFNPQYYQLTPGASTCVKLPYKLVFAIATSDEVLLYDTESPQPIAVIGNLHYTPITDLSWSNDGRVLMLSSTDGFCSYVSIKEDILGSNYEGISDQVGESTIIESSLPKLQGKAVNIIGVKRKAPSEMEASENKVVIKAADTPKSPEISQNSSTSHRITSSTEAKESTEKTSKRRIQPTLIS